jgi:hypothetical protein
MIWENINDIMNVDYFYNYWLMKIICNCFKLDAPKMKCDTDADDELHGVNHEGTRKANRLHRAHRHTGLRRHHRDGAGPVRVIQ